MMDLYKDTIVRKSKELIIKDGETIIQYALSVSKNGMTQLSLIPYMALFCRSAQEFIGSNYIPDDVDKQIKDLRNGLKLYAGKYNKGKKETLRIDEKQDREFRDELRFSIMRKWNIHYNLGVYFDMEGHIIGNTQNLNYYFDIPEININDKRERAFVIGKMLGEKIGTIINDLGGTINSLGTNTVNDSMCGYIDLNTNRKNRFFNKTFDKEINLIMLHLLSSIGFVEHVLLETLPSNDQWLMRVEYVAAHHTWLGLKKIKQHFAEEDKYSLNSDVSLLVDKGAYLFPSEFRNCMMHYDLCDKNGEPTILEEKFDESIPFCGLVESCFSGKQWNSFFNELRNYIAELEEYLLTWFSVDKNKIKWD